MNVTPLKRYVLIFLLILSVAFTITQESCISIEDVYLNQTCTSDCTVLRGQFTTEGGTKPVAGMSLALDWHTGGGGLYRDFKSKIATGRTDHNGNYEFTFYIQDRHLNDGYYTLSFIKPDASYLMKSDRDHETLNFYKRDTTLVMNYLLPRRGVLAIYLVNPEAVPAGDHIVADVRYQAGPYENDGWVAGSLNSQFTHARELKTAGNQWNYIYIYKYRSGQVSLSRDSVFVPSGWTAQYLLEY